MNIYTKMNKNKKGCITASPFTTSPKNTPFSYLRPYQPYPQRQAVVSVMKPSDFKSLAKATFNLEDGISTDG